MTEKDSQTRTIRVEAITRVEGEGALHVRLKDGVIEQVELNIYEPPRFFEALLRGRPLEDVPDITARICGICPIAYQMTSVHALERALGVETTPEIRQLRRLLYCGEWIESHALHIYMLNAPDFLGLESGLDLAKLNPEILQRGLLLKKLGNRLLEVLGGRSVHPVNVAVGGFYRAPRREELQSLIPDFEQGLQAAVGSARWVGGFSFPDFPRPYDFVALRHPDEYPMNEGEVATLGGTSIPVDHYEQEFMEHQQPHSTALHSRRIKGSSYLVGPLARVNLNLDRLSETARMLADELPIDWPNYNPFCSIIARSLEVVHAFEETLQTLRSYQTARIARMPYQPRAGEGCAATEAPRGLIYHRYAVDDEGKITAAKIVPPTSQNQSQIEEDLRAFLPGVLAGHGSEAEAGNETAIGRECEKLIRSYDPCISCSTHFLKANIDRR